MDNSAQQRLDESEGLPKPIRLLLKPRVQSGEQKRQHERLSSGSNVPFSASEMSQAVEAKLVNVSVTGAQVLFPTPVGELTSVEIEVLPGQVLEAKVVWVRPEPPGTSIGLEWDGSLSLDEVWQIRARSPKP